MDIHNTTYSIDDLILGYLNKELTLEQEKELAAWVAQSKANQQHYYQMTEVWLATQAQALRPANGLAYQRFKKRIQKQPSHQHRSSYWQIAASLIIGLFLGSMGLYVYERQFTLQAETATQQTIETPFGSKTRIMLADGTKIWLNAGSKFTYSSDFGYEKREVSLEGEGYFEVVHNKNKPFIVNAQEIDIKVLGTKFNLKSYSDEQTVSVTLAEGSVNVINKVQTDQSLIMKPSEQIVFNKITGETKKQIVSPEFANNWVQGAHYFDEQTFAEIARLLEKSYDVNIVFKDDQLKKLTFYGDFSSNETLDDILNIMSASRKFSYRKQDKLIEIYE